MQATTWPAIDDARRADGAARLPFFIQDAGRPRAAGSVARAHLPALARWQSVLQLADHGLTLHCPAADRVALLGEINQRLRADGPVSYTHLTLPTSDLV